MVTKQNKNNQQTHTHTLKTTKQKAQQQTQPIIKSRTTKQANKTTTH